MAGRGTALIALVFGALLTTPVVAADGDCNAAASSSDATVLSFDLTKGGAGPAVALSIVNAFKLAMANATSGLKAEEASCNLAGLKIGDRDFIVAADDGSATPRRTRYSVHGLRNAYLAVTIKPGVVQHLADLVKSGAMDEHTALTRVGKSDIVYMLAAGSNTEDDWDVYGFYDKIPDMPRLARALCAAVRSDMPSIAVFDRKALTTQFTQYTTGMGLSGLKPDDSCVLGPL